MTERLLTTREAAGLLGVGPTTVKRWADLGLLECVKTVGGHRRFTRHVLEQFQATQGSVIGPSSDWSDLSDETVDDWVARLLGASNAILLQGQLLEARARLGTWWRVAALLGKALEEIGRRWSDGKLRVIDEHRATERLTRALSTIIEQMVLPRSAPLAWLSVVAEDEHTLGLSLTELCLREAGWGTTWLGRGAPPEEIIDGLAKENVQLIAMSASSFSSDPSHLAEVLDRIGPACGARSVPLILGGSGAWPDPPPYGQIVRTFEDLDQTLRRGLSRL